MLLIYNEKTASSTSDLFFRLNYYYILVSYLFFFFFFFNDTATTEIYTLSLHDALPILYPCSRVARNWGNHRRQPVAVVDRKSTRLNSSHQIISYAVFCLKKKKKKLYNYIGFKI